ncbi:bifunctional 2',3'-cyclic-nucleotide 2'-phosphodiesterase/3'-nucleotidase [Neobacillus paridis]|nr:bifunctional 2',3'-cyclic-nucleotide 2'-phosphodiesterase/3'-nucleotidase [Neobacillus paridis]
MEKQLLVVVVLLFFIAMQLGPTEVLAAEKGSAGRVGFGSGNDNKINGGDSTVQLRLLETSDLHVYLANYDYYQTKEDNKVGLVKTATLIKQARKEVKNSMLFDNGDHIQGNPLGDYVAENKGLTKGYVHPVYRAFNLLGYDAITLGNHEFNYGLDFLTEALKGAQMPVVNANILDANVHHGKNKPYFPPYILLKKKVVDEQGEQHTLKVGVIGFTPPQISEWDRANLEGKVITKSIVEAAQEWVPIMKKNGADVIVALAHTGISAKTYQPGMENAAYYLSTIKDIDAILAGHQHNTFPGPKYKDLPHTDLEKGTINGKPVVMPGAFGSHLGVVDLQLQKKHGKWQVVDGSGSLRPITDEKGYSLVATDQKLMKAILPEHKATINYVNRAVGETTAPIFSYFALVKDDPSVQILNNAQTDYLQEKLRDPAFSQYASIPVLSAAAPFKAGGRGGADYYTDIPKGSLAIKNVADLYVYPNLLYAVLVNGAQLKDWLEMSAGQFNQIDPGKTEEQQLINPDFRSYNFDVMDGVEYQIDVTKPAKYDVNGNVLNVNNTRIVNLTYQGRAVTREQRFIVATNNYRASSTIFPGVKQGEIIVKTPVESRQIIASYIQRNNTLNPSADQNWSIAKIKGRTITTFYSSPKAQNYVNLYKDIQYLGPSNNGFAKYSIDLNQ